MKTIRSFLTALASLSLLIVPPNAQSVVPPPDGGYPSFNTAEGQNALFSLTTGSANTAVGWFSLESVATGSFNTGAGTGTLLFNNADSNTAVGTAALLFNTSGTQNTATGTGALLNHTTGNSNTADGAFALSSDTHGEANTAIGAGALLSNTNGGFNVANGFNALFFNGTGGDNIAIGANALFGNIEGNDNTAVGANALGSNPSGNHNVALGSFAGQSVSTASNVICIGFAVGQDVSDSCFIGNIFNATSPGGSAVFIDANNKLGTSTSSKRFKEDIRAMRRASEELYALQPVAFRYKNEIDPEGRRQFGLVAEDVEKVNPDLVVRDKQGKPYSVRYDQVNAMLLNEFLKEHRKGEQQDRKIEELEATVAKLADQLQKVSALMQVNSSNEQVAVIDR